MADGILNPIPQLEADFDFDIYTKQEVDALLDEKADKVDTYTKTETDTLLSAKADADSVYTKTETNNLLNGKADANDVYTKTEIDTKIPNTVGSATKPTYVNGGILTECTYELNKTVPANAVFTDTTYTAGNGLNLSGTSFSAKAGTNVTVNSSGINVNGNGTVASADSGLVSGGTAYTELRPTLDGTWVKNAQTTAINLQKLEGGIEYLYGLLAHQYDQLKKYINGNYYDYQTDTDSKYTKTVPQGAMPYASLEQIGGRTVVWNQLNDNASANKTSGNLTIIKDADNGTWTANGSETSITTYNVSSAINYISGHKYLLMGCPSGGGGSTFSLTATNLGATDEGNGTIVTCSTSASGYMRIIIRGGYTASNLVFVPQIHDLTSLYGAGNEPSTVAEFKQTFPAVWYAHNPGTLLSEGVTEVVSQGRNLYDNANAVTVSGFLSASGLPTGQIKWVSSWAAKCLVFEVKPNTQYTLSKKISVGGRIIFGTFDHIPADQDIGAVLSATYQAVDGYGYYTLTTPSTARYLLWYYYNSNDGGSTEAQIRETAMLTYGNTVYPYSPYHAPIQYPIPADIQALTGYGWSAGSVYNEVDFENKKFIQRVDRVDMGSLSWQYDTNPVAYFKVTVSAMKSGTTNTVCASYLNSGVTSGISNVPDKETMVYQTQFRVRDSSYTDATTFKNSLNGQYLYYELQTPIETDISAYITDDNLIEVEAGGSLSFPNSNGDDYRIDVPSAETYMIDLQASLGE